MPAIQLTLLEAGVCLTVALPEHQPVVALHDIDDIRGFCAATLNRCRIPFDEEEYEELISDGVEILLKLSKGYEPHRAGYAQPGKFSGYAARYLPRRLTDAWRKRHPEMVYTTGEDGKRKYVILPKPLSIEGLRASARSADGGGTDHIDAKFLPSSHWSPVTA